MPAPTALLDANVLYSAALRDFLLRLADRRLFTPLWSAEIHAEWIRSILEDRPDLSPEVLDRTRSVMDQHFPDSLVEGYTGLTSRVDLPDPDDRHVLAAAIHGGADVIVTMNLRDFPDEALAPRALEARHPDAFVFGLLEEHPGTVREVAREHRAALQNPPRSPAEHLAALAGVGLTQTVAALRSYESSL